VLDLKWKTRSLIPNVTMVEMSSLAAHSSARAYGVCLDARRTVDVHEELIYPRFVYNEHLLGSLWWNKCELKCFSSLSDLKQ
jgi:hypothetical protein